MPRIEHIIFPFRIHKEYARETGIKDFFLWWDAWTIIASTNILSLSLIARKYQDYLINRFDADLEGLIATYIQEKQIATLAKENRQIQERMAAQQKEDQRKSEAREKATRDQLIKNNKEMQRASAENRAWYERQANKYQTSIQQEKDQRTRAEELHNEQLKKLNDAQVAMNEEHKAKELHASKQRADLQAELDAKPDCLILWKRHP